MKILSFLLLLIFIGCGDRNVTVNVNSPNQPYNPYIPPTSNPPGQPDADGYIPVAQAVITFKDSKEYVYQKLLRNLSPISLAYAAPLANATVTYVASEVGSMTIDTSSLIATNNGDTLDLGSITISDIQANKLKICGVGGNEKCTQAVIRIYTEELAGHAGIDGFVNTTDSYGVPVYAGKTTASETVGLTSVNSAIVQSYIIPSADRKINLTDFPSPTYLLESDFSNAGAGSYEMAIVVELALAL